MRRIQGEPQSERWEDWKRRANAATQAAIDEYRRTGTFEVDEALYRECRDEIARHFHDKCGYCELVVVDQAVRNPDVEHYRPKGAVKDWKTGKPVNVGGVRHPGYFWLAYSWKNLFPACPACNRPSRVDGILVGKWDFFPVARTPVFDPAVENIDELEAPLILNPYVDDPNDHLTFDIKTAIVGWKTDRGEATVKILDLNRDGLLKSRKDAIAAARAAVARFAMAFIEDSTASTIYAEEMKKQYEDLDRTHIAFRKAVVEWWARRLADSAV